MVAQSEVEDGSEVSQLERELSMYDDCNFTKCESERHVSGVSPRVFATEIGYDLQIEQIPSKLGRFIHGQFAEPVLKLVRVFGDGGFNSTEEKFNHFLDRNAYQQVNVYRMDTPGDEPMFERWANGGFLIQYCAFGDSEIDDRPHNEPTGYYYATHNEVADMVKTLLFNETDNWVLGRMTDKRVLHSDVQYRIKKQGHTAYENTISSE